MIQELVKKTLGGLGKARKEAYPLYYRNVFNDLAGAEGLELDDKLTLKDNINEQLLKTSLGISCHKKGDTIDAIIKRADETLYESKIHRNKVTIKC